MLCDLGCAAGFRVQGWGRRVERDGGLWALAAAHWDLSLLFPSPQAEILGFLSECVCL